MKPIDTIISARWIIPVEPADTVLRDHSLVLHQGNILDILPQAEATIKYQAQESVTLDQHAIIPGLINAHTHAAMGLFRGLADDLPLMEWLEKHIWPAESHWVSESFARDGVSLAQAEMLRSGTTCFCDMYFFPEATAQVARESGMRAAIGLIMIDFPSAYAQNSDEYLEKGLKLHDSLRNSERLSTVFAPHAPYTVNDATLSKIRTLSDELDIPITMHVHETAFEIEQAMAQQQQRPLQRLAQLDLLNPRLMAVHMTQLDKEEIALVAQQGVHVVHCPESNLKLASGFCPVQALLEAGINIALGTDGAASNNDLDMLGEMRTAALLAKGVSGTATALPAHMALRMATLNGARALGLEERTGSLAVGKAADLCAIDLSPLETQPVYDPVSQIVYACGREQVSDVWVAGKRLLHSRQLTTLDHDKIVRQAHDWRAKIEAYDHTQQ